MVHERMIYVLQSVREAIADNKSKTVELEKLKIAYETVLTERDLLDEKLAKAKEEKDKAVRAKNERYLAELPKLRAIHKAELKKEVDDAEDRGYVEGERVYGRQVAGTKDILFQCGWKQLRKNTVRHHSPRCSITPHLPSFPLICRHMLPLCSKS